MSDWPVLDPARDHETLSILHLAAQMLGKIRVAHAPWTNHGWHVALQPNARGLSILPTASGDGRTFTLTLDLCRHAIVLWASDESREELPLNDPWEIRARLEHQVELVLDGGACGLEMSTVIDMTGDTPEVIREGKGSLQPFGISNG